MKSARTGSRTKALAGPIALAIVLAACGDDDDAQPVSSPVSTAETAATEPAGTDEPSGPPDTAIGPTDELFPDVLDATAELSDGMWTFTATLSSPYDTPARYADAWRVIGPDGTVYGVRELTHDHQNEQPFTRRLTGVVIADPIDTVTVQGRDQISGWGGATFDVTLDRG